jgi:hypothetical protein
MDFIGRFLLSGLLAASLLISNAEATTVTGLGAQYEPTTNATCDITTAAPATAPGLVLLEITNRNTNFGVVSVNDHEGNTYNLGTLKWATTAGHDGQFAYAFITTTIPSGTVISISGNGATNIIKGCSASYVPGNWVKDVELSSGGVWSTSATVALSPAMGPLPTLAGSSDVVFAGLTFDYATTTTLSSITSGFTVLPTYGQLSGSNLTLYTLYATPSSAPSFVATPNTTTTAAGNMIAFKPASSAPSGAPLLGLP